MGFINYSIKETERDKLIGIKLIFKSYELKTIANMLLSEFIFMSSLGNLTLKDIVMNGLEIIIREG